MIKYECEQSCFSGWNIIRALRLFFGVLIIIQGIQQQNIMYGVPGLMFTAMSVFNIGCCGSNGCNVPNNTKSDTKNEISYEELV